MMRLTRLMVAGSLAASLLGCTGSGNRHPGAPGGEKAVQAQRVDSIFLGIHLGMVRRDFYMHCWDLNKKGLFTDGTGNNYVLYKLKEELRYPADMNFYPDFSDSTISGMRVNIQYQGWAPWNKHLGADSLLPDVLSMCRKWYPEGAPFAVITQGADTTYIKEDANRQITIKKLDGVMVSIQYTDLWARETDERKHG